MPTILDDYRYDPLDRLVGTRDVLRFYNAKYIATEVEGDVTRCFFTHETQPLAQLQQQAGVTETRLLATDRQHSVVHTFTATEGYSREYSPYGFQPAFREQGDELGFNGERRAPVTGHYLLGQGYRAYNPVLMRFNSPDTLSPFNKGGINSYAYCLGDPVNLIDTDGHSAASLIATIFRNIPAYDQVPMQSVVHQAMAIAAANPAPVLAPVVAPLGRARFVLQGHHSLALVPADRAPVVTVSTSRAAAAIEAPIAMVRASTSRSAQGAAAAPAPIASTSRAASAVAAQNTSSAADFFHARQASRTRQAAAARSAPAPAPQPLPEADTQEAARWIRGGADLW